jgi:hypothetical protein
MMGSVGTYDRDIVRVLDEGVPTTPDSVRRGFDNVIAVDLWRRWAAAFTLSVSTGGEWWSDIHLFQRSERGWQEMTTGGSYGADWVDGWRPQVDDPSHLDPFQSGGQDAEDIDGTDVSLLAVGGYAADGVSTVLVQQGDDTRTVPVLPHLNAFVILGRTGQRHLTALGPDGFPVGPTRTFSLD